MSSTTNMNLINTLNFNNIPSFGISSPNYSHSKIRDVYNDNMLDELGRISDLIDDYQYISMVRKKV